MEPNKVPNLPYIWWRYLGYIREMEAWKKSHYKIPFLYRVSV